MIVVTGAAGFIGSCIVARLNARGQEDLILVDHLTDEKKKNLEGKKYIKYFEKEDFLELVQDGQLEQNIRAIIHMGACSSTTLQDEEYFNQNNFEYTKALANWAITHHVRFIYASSAATYGDGNVGYKDDIGTLLQCKPLNLYGESKQKFDVWALENNYFDKLVGLKFFNVFGPNEYHKGDMRSVVSKAYARVRDEGQMSLFKSYQKKYGDGEQKRDFIYVKDAVDVVMYFLDTHDMCGIFNVGTGKASTWNELADGLFKALNKESNIDYVEMPETIKDKYQYFTQAEMSKLIDSGYKKPFTPLSEAIKDYAKYLQAGSYL